MINYECPRCHHQTMKKSNIKDHYNRKRICKPLFEDISIENCLKRLETQKKIKKDNNLSVFREQMTKEIIENNTEQIKEQITKLNEYETKIKQLENNYKTKIKYLEKENNELKFIHNEEIEENCYIYIIYMKHFKKNNENIYKIGKTTSFKSRMSKYPRGSHIELVYPCPVNLDEAEKELIDIFMKKFVQRRDHGIEYFQGKLVDMVREVNIYFNNLIDF